jgi:transposase
MKPVSNTNPFPTHESLPAPPAAAQGGRSLTGAAAGGAGAPLPPPRRWHAARKAEAVLRLLRGESLDALSRELALPIARLEAWREEGLAGLHAGLSSRQDADPLQFRLDDANRRIGELSMEVELLRIKAARALPFPARRSLK